MKQFNINRFLRVLWWFIVENKQKLTLWTSGSVVGVFLMQMFFYVITGNRASGYSTFIGLVTGLCTMFLLLAFIISVSSLLGELNTKQRRIAFFSLPATNLEKFLTVVLYAGFVNVLCIFLAYAVGDTLRMLVVSLVDKREMVSTVPLILKEFFSESVHTNINDSLPTALLSFSIFLWGHSLYTLGGTLLRKYAFVIVSMFLFVLSLVSVYTIGHVSGSVSPELVSEGTVRIVGWLILLLFLALACVNYAFSFRIFKRAQIITSKWTNL